MRVKNKRGCCRHTATPGFPLATPRQAKYRFGSLFTINQMEPVEFLPASLLLPSSAPLLQLRKSTARESHTRHANQHAPLKDHGYDARQLGYPTEAETQVPRKPESNQTGSVV